MNDLVLKQKIRLNSVPYSDYTSLQEHKATSNKMDKNKMHNFLAVFYPISKWNARKDTVSGIVFISYHMVCLFCSEI